MPFKKLANLNRKDNYVYVPVEEPIKRADIERIVFSNIMNRRSVRRYSKRNVDDRLILKMLEAASFAPSAGNYQPWEFIVVREPRIKGHLIEASYNQDWMATAPIFIVVCTNCKIAGAIYKERGLRLYGTQATAAAIQNMLLEAEALGLATCWVGTFAETIVSRVLECPEYVRPCAIITVGYADVVPKRMPRQRLDDFVHSGKFGNTLEEMRVRKERKPTYAKFH
jgi:nitroreductase